MAWLCFPNWRGCAWRGRRACVAVRIGAQQAGRKEQPRMARRAMGACAMAMGAMAKRAMGGRAMAMGAMAIGARGGLLQQQPLSRGGDQCRDVRGPALKLGRGEPASRGAEPIQLGRARRTAEQAAIAARAGNPINPVVAGTGGGALQCWRVEADTCRGGFALAHVLQRSKQGGYCNAYWSRSRHAPRTPKHRWRFDWFDPPPHGGACPTSSTTRASQHKGRQ